MNGRVSKTAVRCAIYTRVSTDSGLDQDFNSLDAQFEASSAYIKSQNHEGWKLIRRRYDDGGFSGGSTDRPALQALLEDVRGGRIDIIVVYKVDRLTRSLADFARLVDLFDKQGVSFVSVTQQFNTTTSMGRLTLNVLLSFAQFEREVTSERIRDKIAASKRKGLWVGGMVPIGYEAKDRKIKINEREAEIVRHIFQRYLELGGINALLKDLRDLGIRTKRRQLSTGKTIGDIPFRRGTLAYLLRNRFYIGEVRYRNEILTGEQKPILDRELFEAVQAKLDQQRVSRTAARNASPAQLMGRIFDDCGNRMTPTSKLKKGVRYRYYMSTALLQGAPEKAGSISRAPAELIEKLVVDAVRRHANAKDQRSSTKIPNPDSSQDDNSRQIIAQHVEKVEVGPHRLTVLLKNTQHEQAKGSKSKARKLTVAWTKPHSKVAREIIPPARSSSVIKQQPIVADTRIRLVKAIAQGRRWLEELVDHKVTSVDEIARRDKRSVRQVNRAMTLAFLSPRLVEAAVVGKLPRGIGVASIQHLPAEWSQQYQTLGLKP